MSRQGIVAWTSRGRSRVEHSIIDCGQISKPSQWTCSKRGEGSTSCMLTRLGMSHRLVMSSRLETSATSVAEDCRPSPLQKFFSVEPINNSEYIACIPQAKVVIRLSGGSCGTRNGRKIRSEAFHRLILAPYHRILMVGKWPPLVF
ncbi:uncharacterized protein Bfra_002976 [Botrytis fragariae]|uniref:Uncharacterized protein n=1 Tax=Botrytis fragariae TaxID=1964551 RepID=A0A8H6ELE6_9HELO|nr:uncharacterized protein Bfra_002976 [Botrytis fragariae]KAF5876571.1 hypothetical protein Bfra_002976 [Botrytis fragariae]